MRHDSAVRVTWRSIDWLNEDYRSRIEARLDAVAGEGGGADRVEIVSRTLGSGEASCTEVRIAGVIKKCQLTAVREHMAPDRALNDALDAFERNVAYALTAQPPAQSRPVASPAVKLAAMDASGGAAVLSPIERLTDSVQGVLQPVGSIIDRVRDARASSGAGSKPKSAPAKRARRRGFASSGVLRQVFVGAGVFVIVGSGLWWYQANFLDASDAPAQVAASAPTSAEPTGEMNLAGVGGAAEDDIVAYWAIAQARPDEDSSAIFSAVARSRFR